MAHADDYAPALGHVVINVRNVDASLRFYCETLGLRLRRRSRISGVSMAFLTFGDKDHDLALRERGPGAPEYDRGGIGLAHIAFRIGDRLEQLRAFKHKLDARHVEINRMTEHRNTNSIYVRDPDGIEIEIYVDSSPSVWAGKMETELSNPPLRLD